MGGYWQQRRGVIGRQRCTDHLPIKSAKTEFHHHHASGSPSREKPPVGPSSGSKAAHMTLVAPSSTVRGASGPPISVATQPGQTELTRMREARSSSANIRVSALSAAFETL